MEESSKEQQPLDEAVLHEPPEVHLLSLKNSDEGKNVWYVLESRLVMKFTFGFLKVPLFKTLIGQTYWWSIVTSVGKNMMVWKTVLIT